MDENQLARVQPELKALHAIDINFRGVVNSVKWRLQNKLQTWDGKLVAWTRK